MLGWVNSSEPNELEQVLSSSRGIINRSARGLHKEHSPSTFSPRGNNDIPNLMKVKIHSRNSSLDFDFLEKNLEFPPLNFRL